MPKGKDPDEKVVVWVNTSNRRRHVYDRVGGTVMPPNGSVVQTDKERDMRSQKPEGVTEYVMTRREAKKRFGKDPHHDNE